MLKMPARPASFTWMSPAVPVSCIAASACIGTPVAPIGCPLDLRQPDGDDRAVGALERACAEGILLAFAAAELVAEVAPHLRVGIADAVLVVLGRDARERVRLVAMALEIKRGDLSKDAGKAALDVGL